MIKSIRTKRSDGTFKTFIIIEATYDMSLRDIGYKIIKYKIMFCVPAKRIVGRKMIRIEKRSVGTHDAIFPKLMIESICTKRSDGTFKTFIIIEVTHEMSLWDIKERSFKYQMTFVFAAEHCLPTAGIVGRKNIQDVGSVP
jgi:hypothetical protein